MKKKETNRKRRPNATRLIVEALEVRLVLSATGFDFGGAHDGPEFIDWAREPGKTGRKDSYLDLDGGRLVRKVRTGMVFLQSAGERIAAGPCLRYDNQVINFINAQYMNWLQNQGWLICHASGLVTGGRCLGRRFSMA